MRSPLRLAWGLAIVAVLCPVLVALWVELSLAEAHQELTGDLATLEVRTLNALAGRQLLGPYSRYTWSHPGPVYFYLLAPLYAVLGRAPWALHAGAGLIHLACLSAFLIVWLRLAPGPFARLGVCVLATAFTHAFHDAHWPVAFVSIWNPIVTVTAYGCLFALAVAAVCRTPRVLPLVVFLHAFVVQTHIGYGLAASALLLIAGGAAAARLWRGRRRGTLGFALVLFVLLWTPTAIDQVAGTHNLTQVVQFFLRSDRIGVDASEALAHVAERLAETLLAPFGSLEADSRRWLSILLVTAQLAALAAGLVLNRGDPRGVRWWAPLLALAQTAAVAASVTRMDDLDHTFLTHWVTLAGTCNWLAVLVAFVPPPRAAPRPFTEAALLAAAVALPLAAAARSVEPTIERQRQAVALHDRLPIALLGRQLREPLRDGAVLATTHESWTTYAGVVAHLYRSGTRPRLDRRWQHMLGNAFEYDADPSWWLELDGREHVDGDRFFASRPIFVYRRTRNDRPVRRWPLPIAVEAEGYQGELRCLTDGRVPADGTMASSRNAIRLLRDDSAVTIALGRPVDVQTVEIVADDVGVYRLESSRDGVTYRLVRTIPASTGGGLRARLVWFGGGDGSRATHLRLRPGHSEGIRWLAEVAVAEKGNRWSGVTRAETARLAPLFDGIAAAPDDTVPVPRNVVVLPGEALTVRPPRLSFERLELWTEPAATWRVEAKSPQRAWTLLAPEPARSIGGGLAVIAVVLDPSRPWLKVRITNSGDRPQALSEVTGVTPAPEAQTRPTRSSTSSAGDTAALQRPVPDGEPRSAAPVSQTSSR